MERAQERSPDELQLQIRGERVRLVFLQSPLPILISPVAAVVLATALWDSVGHQRLVIWTAGVVALAAARIALVRAYPKRGLGPHNMLRWERAFVGSVVAVALWWGVGGLVLPGEESSRRLLVFGFLILMAGGSAGSYAPHPPTVHWTTLLLVGPIALSFALDGDGLQRALALGALMYVTITFRSIRNLGDFFASTQRLSYEVERQRDRAESLARTDPLTGLNNRRAFYELGGAAMRHAVRYHHSLCLVMIDIDHFKSINDELGHVVGDGVIRSLATLIERHYRETDISCRFGGEEFAVILPETKLDDALMTAERLRTLIEQHTLICEGAKARFTASFGVAAMSDGQSLDQLIAAADSALYAAKRGGRNSVRPQDDSRIVRNKVSVVGSAQ